MTTPAQPPVAPTPPAPVRLATQLLYGVMALPVVGLVMGFVLRDEAVARMAGQGELSDGFAETGANIGIAVGLVVTLVGIALYVVLGVFARRGHGWARIVLSVLGGLAVLGALFNLLSLVLSVAVGAPAAAATVDPPAYAAVRAVLSAALWVAIGVLLWRPASSAFFAAAGAARAQHRPQGQPGTLSGHDGPAQ